MTENTLLAINIRGTHGSGKSVVPNLVVKRDPDIRMIKNKKGSNKPIMVSPRYKLIILGKYTGEGGGGIDNIKPAALYTDMLLDACKLAHKYGYDILFEGQILAGVYPLSSKMFSIAKEQCITPVILYLDVPHDQCVTNILKRNGGKPIHEEYVEQKHRAVWGNTKKRLDEEGIPSIVFRPKQSKKALFHAVRQLRRIYHG